MNKIEHLGSGAYVTFTDYGYIIFTADHHERGKASSVVELDEYAVRNLSLFLKKIEPQNQFKHVKTECEHSNLANNKLLKAEIAKWKKRYQSRHYYEQSQETYDKWFDEAESNGTD